MNLIDRFLEGFPILFLVVVIMFAGLYVLDMVTIHQFIPIMLTATIFNFIMVWIEERFF